MEKLALKDLPEGVTIEDKTHGQYLKTTVEGQPAWQEVNTHCEDCATLVTESGERAELSWYIQSNDQKAEDFFTDWTVVSVPVGIGWVELSVIQKACGIA